MHVAHILNSKGHDVVSVGETTTIAEVCQTLRDNAIGSVVVTGIYGTLAGVISERDIAHGVAAYGAGFVDMTAAQIVTRRVLTCAPESSVDELMHKMTDQHVRHMPVIDRESLTGIVSIGDVVRWRLDELQGEAQGLREYVTRTW